MEELKIQLMETISNQHMEIKNNVDIRKEMVKLSMLQRDSDLNLLYLTAKITNMKIRIGDINNGYIEKL